MATFTALGLSYNYNQRQPARTHEAGFMVYMVYASLGLALGTMTGTAVGMATMPDASAVSRPLTIAASVATAGFKFHPVVNVKPSPAPAVAVAQGSQAATPHLTSVVKRAHRWFWSARRHRWIRRRGISYARLHPVQPPKAVVAMAAPAIFKNSVPAEVARPASFFSEGDATVVDFDASGGKIETYEGRTFAIGTATQPTTAMSWEDYRANVHYRCDQNGNCTLARSGVVVLNAKLQL